ncbi:hypothetical protein RVR_368 [Actinacidiphila reveromycinica]|uniref:Capsule synthesis protein CapA domain-containing protein n=1 Tax=Actinacidiphila reveromycinica TaxID=659352 RepID=A0A7U3UMW3_9ACTN|nr:CapA family protein [Streptomyces sp. SN-593]BBA95486.1 hypothetical protein RVR_368 [Streptomyces sp. SN-593]
MRIVAGGDAIFASRGLADRLDPELVDLMTKADATFANAEFCCPRVGTPPMPRKFPMGNHAWVLDELRSVGVNLLSTANNHSADFGPQGVLDTIAACEERGLAFAGTGRSLTEARAASFLDTRAGRVALVAASSTRSYEFLAGEAGLDVAARAGLNPLRWGQAYVLPEEQFAQLRAIDELLGTAAAHRETDRVEVRPDPGPDVFEFGSVFEGHVRIERGARPDVRYWCDAGDLASIVASVRDAARRAEVVLVSLHCHEGVEDGWYHDRSASFVEHAARACIDAGATAFLGHGPHMLRGVEFHRGRPIFYSLGSLLYEFEMGERLTPENYAGYGLGPDSRPSDLHRGRARDEEGTPTGFYGEARFSRGALAVLDIDDTGRAAGDHPGGEGPRVRVELVPTDLGLNRATPSRRGIPSRPAPEEAADGVAELARMSAAFGTRVDWDAERGVATLRPGTGAAGAAR